MTAPDLAETTPSAAVPAVPAALLPALADTLLPGDGHFPPASAVGAHGWLADRLRDRHGPDGLARLATAVQTAAGADLSALDPPARETALRRLEAAEPDLFAEVRWVLSYGYYQSPLVTDAIRALGIDYNDAPQPHGYPLPPFDPSPSADAPAHRRGTYKRTDEITRVSLAPIGGPAAIVREAEDA